jgi:hypothetical protein
MRAVFLLLLSLFMSSSLWADTSFEPLLNTVTLQLNAEQWVVTKTALVTIGVNASMSGNALEKAQNDILSKLNKISNQGEWHIVSFNRNLDQSGLERVQISAQARLPSSDLSGLRDKAKAMSAPGETFTLDNVEFVPSTEELHDANANLRNDIYQQAKTEIANLNKIYPDQKYYLHSVNFQGLMVPMAMATAQNAMYLRETNGAPPAKTNVSVNNKINLSAMVVIAAAPSQDVIKMVHG